MRTYIVGIIQSIQGYSKKLDELSNLKNQHWVVLNELNESKTYTSSEIMKNCLSLQMEKWKKGNDSIWVKIPY